MERLPTWALSMWPMSSWAERRRAGCAIRWRSDWLEFRPPVRRLASSTFFQPEASASKPLSCARSCQPLRRRASLLGRGGRIRLCRRGRSRCLRRGRRRLAERYREAEQLPVAADRRVHELEIHLRRHRRKEAGHVHHSVGFDLRQERKLWFDDRDPGQVDIVLALLGKNFG